MKSASFIFSALVASASAIKLSNGLTSAPSHLELHSDGKNAGMFMIGNGKYGLFVVGTDPHWQSNVYDLEADIQMQFAAAGEKWTEPLTLTGDCRGTWGDSYLKVKDDDTKYCLGVNGAPTPVTLVVPPRPLTGVAGAGSAGATTVHPRQEEPGADHPWQRPKVIPADD